MKKLFFFLFASILLSSCSCLLSQIPPQYIYAGAGCTSPLPDYKTSVNVTGGCMGFTLLQTPVAGTLLTATNKTVSVVLKASGANGKSSQIQFNVTMLDTITPKITPIGALVDYKINQANDFYNAGDKITSSIKSKVDYFFPYSNFSASNKYLDSTITNAQVILSFGDKRIITHSERVDVSMLLNQTK